MLKQLAVIATLTVALAVPIQPAAAAPLPAQPTCDAQMLCAGESRDRKRSKKWRPARVTRSRPVVREVPREWVPGLKVGTLLTDGSRVGRGGLFRFPNRTKPVAPKPAPSGLRQVVAKLRLPDPTPQIGPDPAKNEWNMLVVGFPIWLWTKGPSRLSTTAKHDGLSYTLTATRTRTVFDTGDGNTKSCAATTPYYWTGNPDDPSPTCGYVYQDRSPIGKPYTIRATTHWRVHWKTGGQHGSLTTSYTGTTKLTIGELQSIIRG